MAFVAVVDYGMGNIDSVRRAFEVCGATVVVTHDPDDLRDADRIVLPGVGAFGVAMQNLHDLGLVEVLTEQVVGEGAPFLGICLGMQLMATTGLEHGTHAGLGWIPGTVRRIEPADGERVPHVGWNEVDPVAPHPLFEGVEPGRDVYFVHSFHVACDDAAHVVATTPYAGGFTSVIGLPGRTIWGVQFHPEKSQQVGHRLIENFVRA